jgi:hypothetical protein
MVTTKIQINIFLAKYAIQNQKDRQQFVVVVFFYLKMNDNPNYKYLISFI